MKKILTVVMLTALMLALATSALAATGLGSVTSVSVTAATAEKAGSVSAYTTMCAVTLDDEGKIVGCQFDAVQPKGTFDTTGAAGEFNAAPQTKNELGAGYGMAVASPSGKDWFEQADALATWCIGKTVEEVLGMQTLESGAPDEADLKTGCTIGVGDFLKALEKAAAAAK